MNDDTGLDLEFAITELEPRRAPSPDANFGSGGGSGGHASFGSGGGSGGGSGT